MSLYRKYRRCFLPPSHAEKIMLKFILATLFTIALFCNTSSAAAPDLTAVGWKYSSSNLWVKKADDGSMYFVKISAELGLTYGFWTACPPGSVEKSDMTLIAFSRADGSEQVIRSLCDGKDGMPDINFAQWKAIVGDLPPGLTATTTTS